jgi:hypothetical protein
LQAIQAAADVVIGGVITVQASRMLMLHRPCVWVRSGAEGIIQATMVIASNPLAGTLRISFSNE